VVEVTNPGLFKMKKHFPHTIRITRKVTLFWFLSGCAIHFVLHGRKWVRELAVKYEKFESSTIK
jgi:hypothetical protein